MAILVTSELVFFFFNSLMAFIHASLKGRAQRLAGFFSPGPVKIVHYIHQLL